MAQSITMTGARAIVKNATTGKVLVTCSQISYEQTYQRSDIQVLGNLLTQDHVIVGVSVSGSLSGFRVPGSPPELQAGSLVSLVQALLTEEELTLTVEDRQSGQTIATIIGAKITNWNESIGARDVTGWSASFVGKVIQREGAPNSERGDAVSIFNP